MTALLRDAGVELRADPSRVIADLFLPGESTPGADSRTEGVAARVLALSREEITEEARLLTASFGRREPRLLELARANAGKVHSSVAELDDDTSLVLGASFTAEHAIEGAALCNPSVVADPDQSGLEGGALRVVVSLRSIGEGHISSISFCSAVIGPGRAWRFEARELPLERPVVTDGRWTRAELRRAIAHDGPVTEVAQAVLQKLPSRADSADVEAAIGELPAEFRHHYDAAQRVETIRRVARSAYDATFSGDHPVSRRVLLPVAAEERNGIEDARFVRFVDDDGEVDYRATYTAYDGHAIGSRLIVTTDFVRFAIRRLTGAPARTKGMALFPRRVGGRLLALTRSDGESIRLAVSAEGTHWKDTVQVHVPTRPWEIVQTGTCGPPIETDRGWLVITHGVGPMRRYSIGALLLDLDDPSRVLARLDPPLIEPSVLRPDGYVPNVVYTCGALVHDGVLWIPYGLDDDHVRVGSVALAGLLDAMTPAPAAGAQPPSDQPPSANSPAMPTA